MPSCQAIGCALTSGKIKPGEISFHVIPNPRVNPEEKARAKSWLHNIGTGYTVNNFKFGDNKRVCSNHFHPNCYKVSTSDKERKRRLLKDGAIPTIFNYKVYDVINMDGETVAMTEVTNAQLKRTNLNAKDNEVSPKVIRIEEEVELERSQPSNSFHPDSCEPGPSRLRAEGNEGRDLELELSTVCPLLNLETRCSSPAPNSQLFEKGEPILEDSIWDSFNLSSKPDESEYRLSDVELESDSEDEEEKLENHGTDHVVPPHKERKFIVTERQLDELFRRVSCPQCQSSAKMVEKYTVGTCLRVKGLCECGHEALNWSSQPSIGKMPQVNLLLSAAIVFTGSTYQAMKKVSDASGIQFLSNETFFRVQRNLVVPAVEVVYQDTIRKAREEIESEINVTGDGRFDSPGKCAKYCTYSCQSVATNKIIALSTIQTKSGKGSAPLELEGYINCLAELEENHKTVKSVSTDRNKQLAKWMREKRPDITHAYDPWHFAKNIKSKLQPLAKKKDCNILQDWINPIGNHVFYCAQNSNGNPKKALAMWKSLMHHVSDRHIFKTEKEYPKCNHAPLTKEQKKKKKWIKRNSIAYAELEKIILDPRVLADIPQLAGANHTGNIEVFNSLILSYAPKRLEFDRHIMDARVKLAVIDFNENVDRKVRVIKKPTELSGEVGSQMMRYLVARQSKNWVAKPIKEAKTYEFMNNLMNELLRQKSRNKIDTCLRDIPGREAPKNIAPCERPDKKVILSKFALVSRFKK